MPRAPIRRQRGIAALVVVMVLFFIISLVAAYTGRNLIFEQRTSTNQYRATQAFEAADAGIQWAIAMLNSGRIGANCQPSANPADTSFRQRYLSIDPGNGFIKPTRADPEDGVWPSCVFDGTTWACDCPTAAPPALVAPAGAGPFPAFRVRFVKLGYAPPAPVLPDLGPDPTRPTIVRVEVNGCTLIDDNCLNFKLAPNALAWRTCQATACAQVALQSGLKSTPAAAITVNGNLNVGGAALTAFNSTPGTSGITIQAKGAVNRPALVLHGAPGTPPDRSVVENDSGLVALTAPRMFPSVFGVWRNTYWQQPAAVTMAPCVPCTAAGVRAVAALNPGRVILVQGDLTLEGGGDIGTVADPVLVVVSGNITFTAPTNIYGFVYSEALDWVTAGTGLIQGAAVAQGHISGTGSPTVVYDKPILDNLYWRTGSFVRVPGSWRDFP